MGTLSEMRLSLPAPLPCRVAIQEAERWNVLLGEMRRSLAELDLGLRGDLTMTEPMASVAGLLSLCSAELPKCLPVCGTAMTHLVQLFGALCSDNYNVRTL